MKNSNTRLFYVDVIKLISVFFVIFNHAFMVDINILSMRPVAFIHYALHAVFSVCVPMFFLVNGFLLLRKPLDLTKHTIRMFKLVLCAVFWNAVCALLNLLMDHDFSVREYVKKLLSADYMWFLQALFVVYVFCPLIKHVYDNAKSLFYWFFAVTAILTFGNETIAILVNFAEYVLGVNYLDFSNNFFGDFNAFKGVYGYPIVYFMMGGVISQIRKLPRQTLIVGVLISWLTLALYGYMMTFSNNEIYDIVFMGYDKIFTLALTIFIFQLVAQMHFPKEPAIVTRISASTLGIYCIQQPIVALAKRTFPTFIGDNLLFNFFSAVLILLVCFYIVSLLKKVPGIRKLITL